MRIVTWNCQQAFRKKADALLELAPDIATIQECSEADVRSLEPRGYSVLWFGSNPRKGMAVLCRVGWYIRGLHEPDQRWVVPIEVAGPISLRFIAVWACRTGNKLRDNYIGQVFQAISIHPEWFGGGGPVVVAGDWNSNAVWDALRPGANHSAVVARLAAIGLVSAYHHHFGERQGQESRPTFHFYRSIDKPFHIDHIFVPKSWLPWLRHVYVGDHERWSSSSDHCPMSIDVDIEAAASS